ncbi:hypothetical protein CAPTEDRAFT_192870 [Capitella teleta]|uniref:Endonuclease/exonuclease/phosphatase domain-containing protein n=1 Tax=Capitella teleta TaxID=283909 RepID=R7UDZ7_CAPTE|nr:hypothetical protein CAPTEDRAFT_192870 [Capitella teleta]|eukprot:ELU01998.1 hypothetical protein CAPTEDRAFT_192870 [Capitella teleta]
MTELRAIIASSTSPPDIIAINEVKPKNSRYQLQPADHMIDGYISFPKNIENGIGRGKVILASVIINAKPIEVESAFEESLWVEIQLGKQQDGLLFGCIYRSPGAGQEDNKNMEELNKFIRKIGDFNLKSINWVNWNFTNHVKMDFLNACTDAFLTQNIQEPTRGRLGQQPSLLDLVLTTADDNIYELEYQSPLGSSDHSCLYFKYCCPIKKELTQRTVTLYDKGNYQAMSAELEEKQ